MIPEIFNFSLNQRGMLPEHRSAGMMPWIIAIMLFLTALAGWCGFALAGATASLSSDIANRVTIQLVEPNARMRAGQVKALGVELPKLSVVARVDQVDEERLQTMLQPWLGDTVSESDIPMPVLFDVVLNQPVADGMPQVAKLVSDVAPAARVSADAEWLAPASRLLKTLQWLSLGLVFLMAMATAAIVVMAVRASLNTHHETIEIMHLMGANDRQISVLFERQIARDTLFGGVVGVATSVLVILPLASRLEAIGGGMPGSGLSNWWVVPMLALLPLASIVLARLVARQTVLSSLGDAN